MIPSVWQPLASWKGWPVRLMIRAHAQLEARRLLAVRGYVQGPPVSEADEARRVLSSYERDGRRFELLVWGPGQLALVEVAAKTNPRHLLAQGRGLAGAGVEV